MNGAASAVISEPTISSPLFRLTGISYRYHDRHTALDNVDFSVAPGEQVVLLGANGCGKSTLLKVLDGLYRPTGGQFWAFGEDVTAIADDPLRARAYHRRVGLVFQDAEIQLFSPTVYDDVAFGPLQMGWSVDEVKSRVATALDQMHASHLADRAPYELSGGEQKRVAIATVLAMDPDVVLLDEPTANLDPRSRAVLVDLIGQLRTLGKTVVVTTHELEIVPIIATRVVVFGDIEHRPVATGTPAEILGDTDLLIQTNLIHERLTYPGAAFTSAFGRPSPNSGRG